MSASDRDEPHEQAAAWLTRLKEPMSLEDELALELWLDSHPDHQSALASVTSAWRAAGEAADLPELIAARADALEAMHKSGRRRSSIRILLRWAAPSALAACLLVAILASLPLFFTGETYATGVGERRVVALTDGSRISLDATSSVEVRYDDERRALHLLGGRVRFDVAKDPRRPFIVTAGGRTVVATGTAFSVELIQAEMRVLLYEGSVAVLEGGPADQAPRHVMLDSERRLPADRSLAPGTALAVAIAPRAAARVEPIDTVRSLSWEQGQLVFSDDPLGVAVERVNRYARTKLSITDRRVAELPVSGAFNAGDTESFVDGVSALYGLRASLRGDTIVLELRTKP